jgi:two-component system response regulator WspF
MMQVGIVNDLRVVAESLRRIIADTPGFSVAWVALNGESAIQHHRQHPADIVLMDLVMPGIDGAETTEAIMKLHPCAILVVTATITGNRELVFAAMGKGALDAVNTPDASSEAGAAELRRKLITVSRLVKNAHAPAPAATKPPQPATPTRFPPPHPKQPGAEPSAAAIPLIGIGASTGGPQAIATILRALPATLNAAVVIVQHLDAQFIPGFRQWLARETAMPIGLATEGQTLNPACIWLAGSGDHLVVRQSGASLHLHYTDQPADTPHHPSVDVFLNSLAALRDVRCCGVLLTGMGSDGAAGLLALRRAGGLTFAQDKATSVVYGMPAIALKLGAVATPTPLSEIAPHLIDFAQQTPTAAQLQGAS